MFKKENRYTTKRISEELPFVLQAYLWHCIDEQVKTNKKIDYLQVFRFGAIGAHTLAIEHTQEQPNRKNIYYLSLYNTFEKIINKKVFVIDDEEYSTMLFAEEY